MVAVHSTEYVFEVRLSSPIARSSLRFTVPAEIAGVSPPNVASAEALVVEYGELQLLVRDDVAIPVS